MAGEEPTQAWLSLPRRVYLDTSTLQTLYDFSEVVFEAVPFRPRGRAAGIEGFADELEALRYVFFVNERAQFEFAVTCASLREVAARDWPAFTRWVLDVLDTWLIQSEGETVVPWATFDDRRFDNISVKDRRLLQDALDVGCDGFLTMERRLPTQADFIERSTGLRVMRPTTYWSMLSPWAALYY
jgi:hypothetical protein